MTKSKILSGLAAAAALVASAAALAEGPKWTYFGMNYDRFSVSGDSNSVDAWGPTGSLGFADIGHFGVSYRSGSVDVDSFSEDFDAYEFSLGVHPALTSSTDGVVNVLYGNVNPDNFDSADYWGLAVGVKSMITDEFELNSMINYKKYGSTNDDFVGGEEESYQIGGKYYWTPKFSTEVSYNDNFLGTSVIQIGLRYNFEKDFF